jgi:hypothetical protein
MENDPSVAYILGRLSAPIIIGLIVMLYFRLTKKRSLEKKEKKIVIWVIVIGYILMVLTAISKVNTSSY